MTSFALTWRPASSEEIWHQFAFCLLGADCSQLILEQDVRLTTDIEVMFDKLLIADFDHVPIFDYWSVPRPTLEQEEDIKTVNELCNFIAQTAKMLIIPTP
ncbi:hypothetical protein [uncultured Gimesia sp.]|uniref:hypothetical protein n=1 Tax=uncultured Gimesia sp. TaxID=1678688 RepID=UPI0030D9632E|tara:strand:+ start:277211 stop:277513 length:303 start_codon:yes stop_codon:yes gene_type:complete